MLKTSWNSGFFSCCNVKLYKLVYYFNTHRALPTHIDDSELFDMYKPASYAGQDITHHFFRPRDDVRIDFSGTLQIMDERIEDQFSPYSGLHFSVVQPFLEKYYSPSQPILDLQASLVDKYGIDVSNTCAIYYRGTDKHQETPLGSFDVYAAKMRDVLRANPDLQIILQSDSYPFLEYMFDYADAHKLQNNISVFEENVTTASDQGVHFLRRGDKAYQDIQHLFASVLVMAQCKYIICSSGNVSLWMMYYRGNAKNVHQFLKNRWIQ